MPLLQKTFKSSIYTINTLFNTVSNKLYRNKYQEVSKHFQETCSPILKSYLGNDYEKHINFNSNKLQRVKVHESPNLGLSLYVVYWPKNYIEQAMYIQHNGCLMKILKGTLTQEKYITNGIPQHVLYNKIRETYNVSYHTSNEIYKTINPTLKEAVSLNMYIS